MWRQILTFADASDVGLARVAVAENIAIRQRAHLDVEILDAPTAEQLTPEEVFFAGRAYGDVLEAVREAETAAVAQVRATLPRSDTFYSIRQREIETALVRPFAARAANAADLVVTAKPDAGGFSARDADVLMGALIEGGAPCLALPTWTTPGEIGRRISIAWRPGPEAARAVRAAAPFLAHADAVRICVANPHRRSDDEAALSRFENYLIGCGAQLEATSMIQSWEGPEPALRFELEGFGADLLVMGAFHHAPLRETLFGGMTVAMLRDAPCAVLLAH